MPSKIVYIKRNKPFVHEQINSESAKEQLAMSRRGIGSYFFNEHTSKKGTGLNPEEIDLLLPQILDVSSKDFTEFRRRVEVFYTEINTFIPYGDIGKKFEVGLTLDNDKPPTYFEVVDGEKKYNNPLNVSDYIAYRHAISHPRCGKSPEEAKGNSLLHYYVEDPVKVLDSNVNTSEVSDEALNVYVQIKSDPNKMRMILTLLRFELPKRREGEPPIIIDNLEDKQVQMLVRQELVLKKPEKFIKVAKDTNLARKYGVDEMISVGLLKRVGTTIFIAESDEPLGQTLQEAVAILWSPERSQLLNSLKIHYEELKRKRTEGRLISTK